LFNLFVAFITGLTTGGLSCLAVQGGLLASSLAGQIEQDVQNTPARKNRRGKAPAAQPQSGLAQPILAFLIAKVIAYTILGFLLGWIGQAFQLSLAARAALQISIGVFMVGSALRMLNVHPIFRYFAFEPPAALRRMLRRKAAEQRDGKNASLLSPIFMGLMTVLIPCGVTQAMMAVALSTGSPLQGAALMFAFTLGTSPVFFVVSYFTTRLGARLEKHFTQFIAAVILILAVVTIDSGLVLAGSPVSLNRLTNGLFAAPFSAIAAANDSGAGLQAFDPSAAGPSAQTDNAAANGASAAANGAAETGDVITINVQNYGYEPNLIHAKAGVPLRLRLVSENVRSCSRAFIIPSLNVQMILDATGEAFVDIPPQSQGAQMSFSCSMGMYTGDIVFDL
jgi:sulfite exporter TauE/SafE